MHLLDAGAEVGSVARSGDAARSLADGTAIPEPVVASWAAWTAASARARLRPGDRTGRRLSTKSVAVTATNAQPSCRSTATAGVGVGDERVDRVIRAQIQSAEIAAYGAAIRSASLQASTSSQPTAFTSVVTTAQHPPAVVAAWEPTQLSPRS
jgi:hypothetical protein